MESADESVENTSKSRQEASSEQSPIVVGIGASAGGIDALKTFFAHLAKDSGFAFVVVIHLSPDYESHLHELLQEVTSLPVQQVSAPLVVEPNHVYVAPPGHVLSLNDRRIVPSDFDASHHRHAPIDHFFRSLAAARPNGIGILLSGGGTDGTLGMQAIKEAGGVLMAQLPDEAKHDSMPRSAIATGLVDFVLPAGVLARKLLELYQKQRALPASGLADDLIKEQEAALAQILRQLQVRSGRDFSGYKRPTLLRRIDRRRRICGANSLSAYVEYLAHHASEVTALEKDLLISVTRFFRDEEAFEALRQEVVPRILSKQHSEPVRVWVPGCATGEEAYSIAMLFLEEASRQNMSPHLQIFATDLDPEALAVAREGLYPNVIEADVAPERLERFFMKEGVHYRAGRSLREAVVFAVHDLLGDPPFSRIDLVSCRNLLIYLNQETQTKVFNVFRYALSGGGYLFLGSSESTPNGSRVFRSIDKKHRIYRCEPSSDRPSQAERSVLPMDVPHRFASRAFPEHAIPPPPLRHALIGDAERHREALEAHAPPSILVDAALEILHMSERASRYLRFPSGRPSTNLMEVIRPELRPQLQEALHEVFDAGHATITPTTSMEIDGEQRAVQIYASPAPSESGSPAALVVFIDVAMTQPPDSLDEPAVDSGRSDTVGQRRQLDQTRQRLRATVDALKHERSQHYAAREELQSVSEEYKLTLEELETSREELQSSNEELKTVNDELQEKLETLSRVNDDLKNLMAATDVAILFLDVELRVKRFTPAATRLFRILPTDSGRPLSYITRRFEDEEIIGDAKRVLTEHTVIEREVVDEHDRFYLLRLAPYLTTEERIEGVVITLVDVTLLHEAQRARDAIAERYRLFVNNVKEYAILMLGPGGRVVDWNRGAERLLGYTDAEALKQSIAFIFTEEDREAGIPEAELEKAVREGQARDERWHVRKDGSRFWASGVLTALYEESGRLRGFAKILRDDTERKAAESARIHFQALFESAPGLYVVLDPERYEIVAASNAYLEATMTEREAIMGQTLFEAFPNDPDDPRADGVENLRASLDRVRAEGRADVMAVLRYPIRKPAAEGGSFEERFWSPINSPVFGPEGELAYIIHRIEDVTPFMHEMREQEREAEGHRLLERRAEHMEAEIMLRAQDLQRANEQLRHLNETLEMRVQRRSRQVRELAMRLTMAEQEERHRLARVLHDDLQQMLFGVQIRMTLIKQTAEVHGDRQLLDQADHAFSLMDEAIRKTRNLSVDLSPNILKGEGLASVLNWLGLHMKELHGLDVQVQAQEATLSEGMRVLLFQIVRELLFNVRKHAGVDRATVEFTTEGEQLTVHVTDEGRGFNTDEIRGVHTDGFGLAHVRERLRLVGGTLKIESSPGSGTRVTVCVPVDQGSM